MSEPDHGSVQQVQPEPTGDASTEIANLRILGADKFDPVHLHYIDVLTQRANTSQGRVKHLLEAKVAHALVAYKQRFEQAQGEAEEAIGHTVQQHPQAQAELQRQLTTGDFKGVHKHINTLKVHAPQASLGELTRAMAQHQPAPVVDHFDGHVGLRPELKTMRHFRNTWSKLSVDKRVVQALDQAPKNAGPINSHMLVLRSLAMMRDISPDYLNRFTSYVDTLLCLEQGEKGKPAPEKKDTGGDRGKKKKTARRVRSR
jgi:hypothetical protein